MDFSCGARLGDCLWSANWMRRLPGEHSFFVQPEYVDPIAELMGDTSVTIAPLSQRPLESQDTWIANSATDSKGVTYNHHQDIMGYVMRYHNALGEILGLGTAYSCREDMLWNSACMGPPKMKRKTIDYLIINAAPGSGQCPELEMGQFAEMITVPLIQRHGSSVVSVCGDDGVPRGYSLSEIGVMATMARRIISVATGGGWPTWNIWAKDAERIIFLDPMHLNFGTMDAPVHHAKSATDAVGICRKLGWL